jgi:hypothetical protein
MNDAEFYLKTIDDLESRIASCDPYDLLRASGLIRQLILDGQGLANSLNATRIKFQFEVMPDTPHPRHTPDFSWVDVSAESGPSWGPGRQTVKIDQFLATKCMSMSEQRFSVREVVLSCANMRGGVHRGSPKDASEIGLLDFDRVIQIGGMDASVRMIRGIAKSLIKGLYPLTQVIRQQSQH